MSAKHDISIDLVKAIGILAIVLGHYGFAIDFVFSFHVPLFFIIGGWLYKSKPFIEGVKGDAKRLLVPYALTACFIALWKSLALWRIDQTDLIGNEWLSALLGGGCPQSYILLGECEPIGAIWFLMALFICRIVYNVLDKKLSKNVLSVICISISVVSVVCYNHILQLPFNILQGLSALIFYDFGRRLKAFTQTREVTSWMVVGCIVVWMIAIHFSFMSMVNCRYDCYPLDIVGAICATCVCMYVCIRLPKNKIINLLAWIGRNSMGLLCLHLIDLDCGVIYKIQKWTGIHIIPNKFIHFLVVVVLSCLIIWVYNIISNKIKNHE